MPDQVREIIVVDAQGTSREIKAARSSLAVMSAELGFATPTAFFLANPWVLFLFGKRTEVVPAAPAPAPPSEPDLTPEQLERALAVLLRAIARAMVPQPVQAAPEPERGDGQPVFETARRAGCTCPCADGATVEFLIEYDAPGGALVPDPDLFSGTLTRGRTTNPPGAGGGAGATEEVEGRATVSVNFGTPALGQLNSGDIIVTFTVKPFFGNGFDGDTCCITARGTFTGTARVASYTNRGQPNESVIRGITPITQQVDCGTCDDVGPQPCCTTTCRWNFNQAFTMSALGFDVDSSVRGVITLEIRVWDHV
ncbi:MAG: hypothetical protein IPH80_28230 [Myxococcales bacterium]|nr:hypothetical protein [Myxococcales bacterium]